MSEERLLQVGDVVCEDYSGRDRLFRRHIDRVTNTLAFSGDTKWHRKIRRNGFVDISPKPDVWSRTSYFIETDALKAQYIQRNMIAKIEKVSWSKLPPETIKKVYEFLFEGKDTGESK